EKKAGFRLPTKDVFLNVTGGISIEDPALDLSVIAAIWSSNEEMPISKKVCFAGEVGLAGEIRPVTKIEQRISEAEKLGFDTIMISKYCKIPAQQFNIAIVQVAKIEDVLSFLFG
ncbi:magnesium chelatase domain-containing protein, partial [Arthrospira platensis SPKY1]|nr:magnesium chelatase domain-containing protein [Arthrospira platensis SPKY1]